MFIDDISMPIINNWGDQITNEIVRQALGEGGVYSLDKPGEWKNFVDMCYSCALVHPGGGRNDIPNRLKRQFCLFNVTMPSIVAIDNIFGSIIRGRLSADVVHQVCHACLCEGRFRLFNVSMPLMMTIDTISKPITRGRLSVGVVAQVSHVCLFTSGSCVVVTSAVVATHYTCGSISALRSLTTSLDGSVHFIYLRRLWNDQSTPFIDDISRSISALHPLTTSLDRSERVLRAMMACLDRSVHSVH